MAGSWSRTTECNLIIPITCRLSGSGASTTKATCRRAGAMADPIRCWSKPRGVDQDPKNQTIIVTDKTLNAVLTYHAPGTVPRTRNGVPAHRRKPLYCRRGLPIGTRRGFLAPPERLAADRQPGSHTRDRRPRASMGISRGRTAFRPRRSTHFACGIGDSEEVLVAAALPQFQGKDILETSIYPGVYRCSWRTFMNTEPKTLQMERTTLIPLAIRFSFAHNGAC